jgi:ATP-dependent DNA ligase
MEGEGETVFRHACKLGLEGIVSKRKDSAYRSGRPLDWLKMKNADAPAVKTRGRGRLGKGALAAIGVSALGSDSPYVVLVNVGVAELEGLRERVRGVPNQSWWDHEVKVKDGAVLFCFENYAAALMFEAYCKQNHIPCRREW